MGLQIPAPLPSPPLPDSIIQSLSQPYHESLRQALHRFRFSFFISDPCLRDHPVVFASDGFLRMTGYLADEILGRNCRFLEGPDTDRRTILEIRDAIREERACQVTILSYTKQGWPFWNLFHMSPLFSKDDGRVVHFVAVQTPVSGRIDRELSNPTSSALNAIGFNAIRKCCCDLHGKSSNQLYYVRESGDDNFPCVKNEGTDPGQQLKCEVCEADKQKSARAMRSLLLGLVESSKCKGSEVTQRRCSTVVAHTAGGRVVSSSLMLALAKIQQSFILANPHLPGMPIVYASDMFLRLTGYSRNEVLGCNWRFLQGPDTEMDLELQIQECIDAEKACTVRILSYRKDKTPFRNSLHFAPVRSSGGKVAFFVGVHLDVTSSDEDECQENGMTPHMQQLGAVGAIRVAVRSLQGPGLCRIQEQLHL